MIGDHTIVSSAGIAVGIVLLILVRREIRGGDGFAPTPPGLFRLQHPARFTRVNLLLAYSQCLKWVQRNVGPNLSFPDRGGGPYTSGNFLTCKL